MVQALNIDAFPMPVTVATFGEASRPLNKRLLADTERSMVEMEIEQRTGIGINQTISGLEDHYDSYRELADIITEFSKPIIYDTGTKNNPNNIRSEFFWANRNTSATAFHMPHSHQLDGYMWTGVYFPTSGIENGIHLSESENLDQLVQVTSDTQPYPGALTLLDPIQFVKQGTATKLTDRYPYWGNPLNIRPKEGTIVMFPTYLPHLVTPTEKEGFYRVSIAFYVKVHDGDGGIDKGPKKAFGKQKSK